MLLAFEDRNPVVAESAWIGPGSWVIGDVVIGERSTVWPGAVVRADFASIRIGENVHVEDNVVIHSGEGITLGNNVTIGHSAVVHCAEVHDGVLLANNSTVLDGAIIGEGCIIAAGALVPPREVVPPHSIVMGVPGVIRPAPGRLIESRRGRQTSATGGYHANAMRYRAAGIEERQLWTPVEGAATPRL
jgi:carbonic anhydrase/acetyltransferase-like protein (isoleucine patch superfamily)